MKVVLISGLSGSGKSIALKVLEDAAYYCVDNLPAPLLVELVQHLCMTGEERLAVAIDMRGGSSIATIPPQLKQLESEGFQLQLIFLDTRTDILIQRFSETRRRHPMASADITLEEAIKNEREALTFLATIGHHIDTSHLRPNALRAAIKDFILIDTPHGLTLLFESFGFKYGLPADADFVFDTRFLPNPFYVQELSAQTGNDPAVRQYVMDSPVAEEYLESVRHLLSLAVPHYTEVHKLYAVAALGCTGGRHRSVTLVNLLAEQLQAEGIRCVVQHRDIDRS